MRLIHTIWTLMISRLLAVAIVICTAGVSIGCHRGTAAAAMLPIPVGLDSVGVERWLGEQRSACRGRLVMLWDEGGAVRNFDSATTTARFRYRSGLRSLQCRH
jgi:hypothetical protein